MTNKAKRLLAGSIIAVSIGVSWNIVTGSYFSKIPKEK